MIGSTFMQISQKLALHIWNQYCSGPKKAKDNHYVLTFFKVYKIDASANNNTLNQKKESPDKKGSRKISHRKSKKEIPIDKKMSEIFTYENNEVRVDC